MLLGTELGAYTPPPEPPSVLDSFLGVKPGYLKEKLDGLELLMWLSVAAGLSSAVAVAIDVRRRRK
jgi:hypothetical protein